MTMTFAGKVVRTLAAVAALAVVCASLLCSAITYAELTGDQKTSTLSFLRAFAEYSTELKSTWTGDDFCSWANINCDDANGPALEIDQTSTSEGKLTRLPELAGSVDGSQVVITQITVSVGATPGLGTVPSSWSGLTAVTAITLTGNGLTGSLPGTWSSLVALQNLYLDSNQLTKKLPSSWGRMSAMVALDLANNKLTGTIPEEWSAMSKLQHVDFTRNKLCGCLPSWAIANPSLAQLDSALESSKCDTENACPADASSSSSASPEPLPGTSSSSSSSHALTASSSSKTDSHKAFECAVSHCVTCQTGNANNCAQCAENYELTGNQQCALKESNGAVRVSWSAGYQWVALAVITLASATHFLF